MQGCAHLPNYDHEHARLAVYDDAVRKACETGRNPLVKRKSAYDAAQGGRSFPRTKKIPHPELTDVLYCLVTDSDAIEYSCFEDWADMFGYDQDSRKAEKIYRACLDTALQLRQLIDIDAAREAFQDY